MKLIKNGDVFSQQTNQQEIADCILSLEEDDFCILEQENEDYMQMCVGEEVETSFIEYKNTSSNEHFQATYTDREEVIAAMTKYLQNDTSYKQMFTWNKITY